MNPILAASNFREITQLCTGVIFDTVLSTKAASIYEELIIFFQGMLFLPEGTSPLCTNCHQKFVVKFVACSWIMLQNIIQNFLVDISPSRDILINSIFFGGHFWTRDANWVF